jgi:hypothetical protein
MLGYDVRLWELLTVTSPVGQLFDVQVLLSKFGEQRVFERTEVSK